MTKLDWNKFEPLFGTWASKVKPFFDKGGFDPIYSYLKSESKRNKRIAPMSSLTYRCFIETPISECTVILCGFCPYHTFTKDGISIADGLCMSCEVTNKLQPSLSAFYEGIENEMYDGLKLDYFKNPSLKYLASQGILLFNSSLTVSEGKPGSHQELWDDFMKHFFQEVVGYSGIPVIFLGKEAAKCEKYVTPFTHVFKLSHPAYAARMNTTWDTENCFRKVSKIIRENHNYNIMWLDESCPF